MLPFPPILRFSLFFSTSLKTRRVDFSKLAQMKHFKLGLIIDSFTPGQRTGSSFFQNLCQQSQQNMVLLSFVDIQKIWIFTKFGGCSSKIEPATLISILKFKRVWQTQFFSHTLQILVNDRFLIGHQMIFYSMFCISNRKAEI